MRDSSATVQLHPKFPNAAADSRDVDLLAIKTFQMQSVFTNHMCIYFSYKPAANRLLIFFSLSLFLKHLFKGGKQKYYVHWKSINPTRGCFWRPNSPGLRQLLCSKQWVLSNWSKASKSWWKRW